MDDVVVCDDGILADITLLPGGETETAYVAAPYAGNGFGMYFPIEVEDLVVVVIPDGDAGNGPVILGRYWRGADKPPTDIRGAASNEPVGVVHEPSPDVVLRAKPGANTQVIVSAGANVTIKVEGAGTINLKVDGGTVNLGSDSHTTLEGVVNGQAIDPFTGQTHTALGNASSKVFAKKS